MYPLTCVVLVSPILVLSELQTPEDGTTNTDPSSLGARDVYAFASFIEDVVGGLDSAENLPGARLAVRRRHKTLVLFSLFLACCQIHLHV